MASWMGSALQTAAGRAYIPQRRPAAALVCPLRASWQNRSTSQLAFEGALWEQLLLEQKGPRQPLLHDGVSYPLQLCTPVGSRARSQGQTQGMQA